MLPGHCGHDSVAPSNTFFLKECFLMRAEAGKCSASSSWSRDRAYPLFLSTQQHSARIPSSNSLTCLACVCGYMVWVGWQWVSNTCTEVLVHGHSLATADFLDTAVSLQQRGPYYSYHIHVFILTASQSFSTRASASCKRLDVPSLQ